MTQVEERRLAELIEPCIESLDVEPDAEYRIAGIHAFGRGVFGRGPITGSQTSYRKLNKLRSGMLVMSRLKAFEGAIAIVPDEFDGWFASQEFPTFACREGVLEAAYLSFICRWPDFWTRLAAASKGIGARRERVHADQLLQVKVPYVALDQQRQVASRLHSLSTSVDQLLYFVERERSLSDAFTVSLCSRPDLDRKSKIAQGWQRVPLGSVLTLARDRVRVDPHATYPNLGIYSFGRGVFKKPPIEGSNTSATSLNRVRAGQFIYSRLFAFEGAYAHVPNEFDGYFVSNEFPAFDVDEHMSDARWLACYLRSLSRWAELGGASKGLGVRRQRVPVDAVLEYEVWLPPLAAQRSAIACLTTIDRVASGRAVAVEHIDALAPSALNEAFSSN